MAKYIGKRIVPKHCGEWDRTKAYEMESIVYYRTNGNSYISRRDVPVNTDITQTEYWALCSDFSEQMDLLEKHFTETEQRIKDDNDATEQAILDDNDATEAAILQDNDATKSAILQDNEATEQAITQDNANTRSHVDQVTGDALTAMNAATQSFNQTSAALTTRMNSIAGQATEETEVLDARVDADGVTHENLGEAVRSIAPALKAHLEDARVAAKFFTIPEAVEPEIAVEGYYIAGNHSLVIFEPFSISESIPVKEGDMLVANFTCNGSMRCIAYYDEETDTYSDSIVGSNTLKEFTYRATRDGNLRLCYMPQYPASYRVVSSESLQQVIDNVRVLQADDFQLMKLLYIMQYGAADEAIAEVGQEGKYVNLNLAINNYSGCYITSAIPVKKDDLIIGRVWRNTACTQVAYCNETADGDFATAFNNSGPDVLFVSDRDGYICFSTNINLQCRYTIYHSDTVRDFNEHIALAEQSISEHREELDALKILPENLLIEQGKNLFDKDAVIEGYYIGSELGTPTYHAESAISALIPVEAGHVYTVKRTAGNLNTGEIAYVAEDGQTRLKPLDPDGTERNKYMASLQMTTMAPEGAAFCQFTVKFKGNSADYDKIQFEEGSEATEYVPYLHRPYIGYNLLPTELNGLAEKTDDLVDSTQKVLEGVNRESITIANSGKIGFFSNSFLNGYTMRTHHALDNLGMWSDYIMYNYGKSGDDALECLARINANQTFFGHVPVQNWGLTYGVIAMQDNDGALFAADPETYRENFKKIAEAIRAMGAIPILGTEHDWTENYYGLMALAEEEGYLFMDWGKTANAMGRFNPFWHNGHPATRTHWLWTYGMKPYLDTLPRPDKGIKLFRKRPDTENSLDAMMFNNNVERAERFVELDNGYSCLTAATAKYFDRLNNGQTEYEYLTDEYQLLQNGESVSFGSHALIDCILPYAAGRACGLTMNLNAAGVQHAYIKRILSLTNPLPESRYIAFGVTDGAELLTSGSTFQITDGVFNNSILGEYTVDQVVGNVVVTRTSSNNKTTSGTDTPVCSIDGVILSGSYDYPSADYMLRFDKPLGEWVEFTLGEDGSTDLSSYMKHCVDFDKVSILLTGEDIVVSSIDFTVEGTVRKQTHGKKMPVRKDGESLITDTLLGDDSAWENIQSILQYDPVTSAVDGTSVEPLPNGISAIRVLDTGEALTQAYDRTKLSKDAYHLDHIQIRVLARYFPKYIDTDAKWETSDIYEGSYDCAQMSVVIDGKTKCARTPVGAFWNEFIFDVLYQGRGQINKISVQCDKKQLQIAKVEMVLVKD